MHLIAIAKAVRTTPNAETFTRQSLPFCLACGNGFAELPSALEPFAIAYRSLHQEPEIPSSTSRKK
ncbi:MAG: hypothetical protein F6J86_11690 [Symploca sp. SIO1B1]|nr:hypothetical protein [Symploca sp. SIO1B1]